VFHLLPFCVKWYIPNIGDKKEVGVTGAEAPSNTKTYIYLKIKRNILRTSLLKGVVELAKVE
jgi:hypothetical protein